MDKVAIKRAQEEQIKEPKPIILERWAKLDWDSLRLTGYAFGHPNFPDNTEIMTSRVVWLDEQIGMAKTLNTVYILRNRA